MAALRSPSPGDGGAFGLKPGLVHKSERGSNRSIEIHLPNGGVEFMELASELSSEETQSKTFLRWINFYLARRNMKINDLRTDLSDGVALINLVEEILGEPPGKTKIDHLPTTRVMKVHNINCALSKMTEAGLRLIGISAENIADGHLKTILGLVWLLIYKFQIQPGHLRPHRDSNSISAGTGAFKPLPLRHLKHELLGWCRQQLLGYSSVANTDFNSLSCFGDGLVFCALLHKLFPESIPFHSLTAETANDNLSLAFRVAEERLGIPRLLDANDVIMGAVDEHSLLTYLSFLRAAVLSRQPSESVGIVEGGHVVVKTDRGVPVLLTAVPRGAVTPAVSLNGSAIDHAGELGAVLFCPHGDTTLAAFLTRAAAQMRQLAALIEEGAVTFFAEETLPVDTAQRRLSEDAVVRRLLSTHELPHLRLVAAADAEAAQRIDDELLRFREVSSEKKSSDDDVPMDIDVDDGDTGSAGADVTTSDGEVADGDVDNSDTEATSVSDSDAERDDEQQQLPEKERVSLVLRAGTRPRQAADPEVSTPSTAEQQRAEYSQSKLLSTSSTWLRVTTADLLVLQQQAAVALATAAVAEAAAAPEGLRQRSGARRSMSAPIPRETAKLEEPIRRISVRLPNAAIVDVECRPSSTIESLKHQALAQYPLGAATPGAYSLKIADLNYYLPDDDTVAIRLSTIPIMDAGFQNGKRPPLLALATREECQREQKLSSAIGSLIGKPLVWQSSEDESAYFRRKIQRRLAATTGANSFREWHNCQLAKVVTPSVPADFPSEFTMKVHLPGGEISKTVKCTPEQTLNDIMSEVLRKAKATHTLNPTEYVFKIAGMEQYLVDMSTPLSSILHVRECLIRNKKIVFSLVQRTPTLEAALAMSVPHQLSIPVDSNTPSPAAAPAADIDDDFEIDQLLKCHEAVSLLELRRAFEVKVVRVDNVALPGRKVNADTTGGSAKDAADSAPAGNLALYVDVGMYYGGRPLAAAMSTQPVLKTGLSCTWEEWLRSDMLMCNIPREARLCVTVYMRDGKQAPTPIGWVNMQLFDFRGFLVSGTVTLRLWPDARANPIGTCVDNVAVAMATEPGSEPAARAPAVLTLAFHKYPQPIVFPRQRLPPPPAFIPTPSVKEEARILRLLRTDPLSFQRTRAVDFGTPPAGSGNNAASGMSTPSTPATTNATASGVFEDPHSRHLLWQFREYVKAHDRSQLAKVLLSAPWHRPAAVCEVHRLLDTWGPLPPLQALELLDASFVDARVRAYAVGCLATLSDDDLADYLLQLVQVLKYEPYHYSALAVFLLERAVANRLRIGHALYWHLRSEMGVPEISERYGLLLEAFLRGAGEQRTALQRQLDVVRKLRAVAARVKEVPLRERKVLLDAELEKVGLPFPFELPLNPTIVVSNFIVEKCKSMDSAKAPLWLVFENADPVGDPVYVIFKSGDDLRQDLLTLQMLNIMDKMWKNEGVDLHLTVYGCIATGEDMGMIEVVLNSETTAAIQKAAGGVTAALTKTPLANWLKQHHPHKKTYDKAVKNFVRSCAGYCVATYVLGIGDRHNDNIMVNKDGHLFHIDFGHFLGNFKKWKIFRRERAPFVFTPEFAYVMGGKESKLFSWFVKLCGKAYNILRKHANVFITLFMMMLSTGIPELKSEEDIEYLRDAFSLDLTSEEAAEAYTKLIHESLSTKATQINFMIHLIAHRT